MKLIIIRHAQSIANEEKRWQGHMDYELTEKGKTQSYCLKEHFEKHNINPNMIYSSPLKRALDTALLVFPERKIIKIPDLIEGNSGVFSGKTNSEIQDKYPEFALQFKHTQNFDIVPEAESRYELRKRAVNAMNFLIQGHNDDNVVSVVSHGGIMAFLLAVILGTNRVWKLKIPNTAVFEFNINPDRWVNGDSLLNKIDSFEIIKFLDVSHLFTD